MRKVHTAALTVATLVVAGAYYGLADSLDIVPGPLTAASQSYETQPYPTPSIPPDGQDAPSGLDPDARAHRNVPILPGERPRLGLPGRRCHHCRHCDRRRHRRDSARHEQHPLTPASSNKILTASAALSLLGPEHALTTKAVVSGGTVTLVGGGDVLLAADAGDPDATVGHAGLGDLARSTAQALQARGVTSVNVALDDTLFTGPSWNSSWEGGNEAWVAQIQPIMLDVTAHSHTGGYPADPAMEAAQTFSDQLASAGVTVSGDVSRSAAPSDATELASVASAPLADVLSVSLKASDNTMTEVEGRMVAVAAGQEASFEGATKAVLAQLTADGFQTGGVTMVDCSGLATADRVPSSLLAQIIAHSAGSDGGSAGRTLLADLPVGGLDGTLEERFVGVAGAGTVRAKTGSLDTAASLTGTVVTADGRQVAFAVIVDGFEGGGLTSARTAIDDDVIVPLAGCGCSG